VITRIGLLSKSDELIDEFSKNITGIEVKNFHNIDSVRDEDFSVLAVDSDFFESIDTFQFYLSKIRKKFKGLPVLLVLKAKYLENIDLEWFFDDLILYPFRKMELMARIKRQLWDKNLLNDNNIISIGNLKINVNEYSIYLNNQKLDFTYKEFELLRFMVLNRGVVFTRKDLLSKIWGVDYIGGTRTVDVHIRRLRSKLGDEFNSIIETVRNVGYRCISM
jgi:DNA-binding response OmpR family regulator